MEWWLYFLRELVSFDEIPSEFQGDIIEGAFNLAKLANMSHEDRHAYELSLKYYRDFMNVLDTTKNEAEQSRALEIAKNLLVMGLDIESIVTAAGLTKEMIL